MQTRELDLHESLARLFTAFPVPGNREHLHEQRRRQYHLYHERLAELPIDLVDKAILEFIDKGVFLPRISSLRARVREFIRHHAPALAAPASAPRAECVQAVGDALRAKAEPANRITGSCQRIRRIADERQPCGRPYEYTQAQARWLQHVGEKLLCHGCAGDYLARQGQLRRDESIWAENTLARLSQTNRPTQDDVDRLRRYGYGQRLQERLIAIGAYSQRRY